jgi:hypothetical protein
MTWVQTTPSIWTVGSASAVTSELERLLIGAGLAAAVLSVPVEAMTAARTTHNTEARKARRRTNLADMNLFPRFHQRSPPDCRRAK